MNEELDPILIQVTVPLPPAMIFGAFTDGDMLRQWLCESAKVEPQVGGAFELAFQDPVAFVSRGRITALTPEHDIGFSWYAPKPFERLMNEPAPKSAVYVRLQESPEGIDVTLEQTGWVSGPEWEEARSWHFGFWDERLRRLKEYLLREAYG